MENYHNKQELVVTVYLTLCSLITLIVD